MYMIVQRKQRPPTRRGRSSAGGVSGLSCRAKILGAVALVNLVGVFAFCSWRLSIPDGTYDFSRLAVEGYSYLRFRDGQVILLTPGSNRVCGNYSNEDGKWVWTGYGERTYLRPSFLRMHFFRPNGEETSDSPLRRVFLTGIP